MGAPKGWSYFGNVDGVDWEKKKVRNDYIMVRPVGTTPDSRNPDDPHIRVDIDASGNPIWSTFHSNFNGYFGMGEVVRTALTLALSN